MPAHKIVVGKPATAAEAYNTGYVSPSSLAQWSVNAYHSFGWSAGFMFWQFRSDLDGQKMLTVSQPLITAVSQSSNQSSSNNETNTNGTNTNGTDTNGTDSNNTNTNSTPVRLVYVDEISAWWPPSVMVHDMGVPGYAAPNNYNYIVFAFWLTTGPADIALLWSDPIRFFGTEFGSTKD